MPRESRKESQTGYYHVMMRGNNKEKVFEKTTEKQYFIEQLRYQIGKETISLVAYCLMDNHVHLLIHSELQKMIESLKWVNIKFAGLYNLKYERVGHVFQDRFKSEVIDTEEYLIGAMRYIHNNPIKARIVSNIDSYHWSSYKEYVEGKSGLVSFDEREMILGLFSRSIEQFKGFHLEEENSEFLEIKEDLDREREERARMIINKSLKKHGLKDIKGLHYSKEILEDIVMELLRKSCLPHRKIAELLEITRGTVHNISKKYD